MNPQQRSDLKKRLRKMTDEAIDRMAASEGELQGRGHRPPRPGELFLLPTTEGLPVEWLVVDRDPADRSRLLLAPADTNPLIGSADVSILENSPAGPLSIRCRFGVWLESREMLLQRPSGFLKEDDLRRVQARLEQLERDSLSDSLLGRRTDADPEYQDWIESVPRKAYLALSSRDSGTPAPAPNRADPGRIRDFLSRPWSLAASIAALIAIGFGAASLWDSIGESAELQRLSRRVAELERSLGAGGEEFGALNLQPVWLTPSSGVVRGDPRTIDLDSAQGVFLIIEVSAQKRSAAYRVAISDRATGREIWSSGPLLGFDTGVGTVQIGVALARRSLQLGQDLAIRLSGIDGDDQGPIQQHVLRFE